MTWVAWRQQRFQVLLSIGIVAVLAAVMAFVRFDALSLGGNEALIDERYGTYLNYLRLVLIALPVLLGMFAGAPLFAREIEHGTHVFGLTQSIGRTRWWATKIAVAGIPVVIAMTVLGLVNAWSSAPLQAVMFGGRLATPTFEIQGLTLGAYTLLTFTLSAAIGLLMRNTLAAMVVTVVVYIPLLGAVANALRPGYGTPITSRYQDIPRDAWVVESSYVDAAGNQVSFSPAGCTASINDCLTAGGVVQQVAYQPDDRFWSFQAIEAGLFAVLAVALLGVGAWALHRRLRLA
ncbi:ABC transporter permease [Lentzea tibetensis]|uniref:ABC transporter permease n=1 Tax=Lentzea tibetensis TaxID=2591470 RepID=A0A563F1D6_9PSEU|nr:ABC transporter permease [Lentzea tibetensis]TWP53602.1 ABC transporter permease [Lentzea tibetensis]